MKLIPYSRYLEMIKLIEETQDILKMLNILGFRFEIKESK